MQLSEVAGVEEEYFHWDNDSDDEQFVQLEEDNLQKEETKKQKHTETYDFGQYLEDLKTSKIFCVLRQCKAVEIHSPQLQGLNFCIIYLLVELFFMGNVHRNFWLAKF